jgi:hypothetical protein
MSGGAEWVRSSKNAHVQRANSVLPLQSQTNRAQFTIEKKTPVLDSDGFEINSALIVRG